MYISNINLENFQIEEWPEGSSGVDLSSYSNFEIQNHLDDYFRFFGATDIDIIYMYFMTQVIYFYF